jgi:hypothetical protein
MVLRFIYRLMCVFGRHDLVLCEGFPILDEDCRRCRRCSYAEKC